MARSTPIPSHLTSPGAALAYQAKEEQRLVRALERESTGMLLEVKDLALRGDLTVAGADRLWATAVDKALLELGLDANMPERAHLRSGLIEQDLGQDAYTSASAVMQTAASTYPAPSRAAIAQALDEALSLESPTLVASAASILAKLKSLGQVWKTRVHRSARTGFTGFMGVLAQSRLQSAGFEKKRWVARHDEITRGTHLLVDGQEVPINAPFVVGGVPLMYPGDRLGPIQEVANCRCVIVGADHKDS